MAPCSYSSGSRTSRKTALFSLVTAASGSISWISALAALSRSLGLAMGVSVSGRSFREVKPYQRAQDSRLAGDPGGPGGTAMELTQAISTAAHGPQLRPRPPRARPGDAARRARAPRAVGRQHPRGRVGAPRGGRDRAPTGSTPPPRRGASLVRPLPGPGAGAGGRALAVLPGAPTSSATANPTSSARGSARDRGGRGRLAHPLLVRGRRVLDHAPPPRGGRRRASARSSSGPSAASRTCSACSVSRRAGGCSARSSWDGPTGTTPPRRRSAGDPRRARGSSTAPAGERSPRARGNRRPGLPVSPCPQPQELGGRVREMVMVSPTLVSPLTSSVIPPISQSV